MVRERRVREERGRGKRRVRDEIERHRERGRERRVREKRVPKREDRSGAK